MATRINPNVVYLPPRAIQRAARQFSTPFFIYEENRIRANCRQFSKTFRRYFPEFTPLFAVKANTNPALLRIIFAEGFGADASSEAEAWITKRLGATGMYTGNYTTAAELRFVLKTGNFRINLDDISILPTLRKIGTPEFLSFLFDPGISQGGMKSLFLAWPDAKFGIPTHAIVKAYRQAKAMGVRRFGIHAMTGSNVLDERYFAAVAGKLLDIAGEVKEATGIDFECLNVGGGFGVPYRPEQPSLNLDQVASGIRRVFDQKCKRYGLREPVLMVEPGRWIMADTAWLVGRVHVIKYSSKTFVGLDTGMNDLPRPAIYDAYHHITVIGKPTHGRKEKVNIVGRLCENNDQFARDRCLPTIAVGDLIAIHNAGAHAYAMGHNYNNRLRSAEILILRRGGLKKIRRAETIRDLFRTTKI